MKIHSEVNLITNSSSELFVILNLNLREVDSDVDVEDYELTQSYKDEHVQQISEFWDSVNSKVAYYFSTNNEIASQLYNEIDDARKPNSKFRMMWDHEREYVDVRAYKDRIPNLLFGFLVMIGKCDIEERSQ